MTEVPWLFAAPTGANKVTVYWDEVPGATGYRVRWGTTSGSYPNSSAVLPATARQHTVVGLDSEREYYFVVEAAYNGLWGPPSEEDSAVPHEGAIPWDTLDPNQIIPAVRNRAWNHKRGQEWSDPERRIPPPSYNRWQPYLKIARGNRLFPIGFEEIGVPKNHIRYENAPYGLIVRLRLIPDVRRAKGVEFRAKVWAAEFDDPNDYPRFICDFYGFADVKPPDRFRGAKTRRVISIAQIRPGSDGYKRTGSFFEFVGVGYQPLFSIGELPYSAYAYCPPFYQLWTGGISDPPTNFPPGGSVVNATVIEPYFQEYVHINLRR